MQRFSIIVPVYGNARLFDDTLASVLRYRPSNSQVLVVHDEAYQDSYGLDGEVEFVATEHRDSLAGFLNCGLSLATGEFVALIRPGVELDEGWDESVENAFDDDRVASVTPIITTPARPETMVAAGVAKGVGFHRKVIGLKTKIAQRTIRRVFNSKSIGPTSWAAFYRREALNQIGTLDERLDSHFVDLDLALSLRSLGYRNEFCPDCVVTVDRARLVTNELTLPHGLSAQRGAVRHPKFASTSALSSALNFISEIAASPFSPWHFRHAIQRLGAMRLAKTDKAFADQISLQKRQNKRAQALGLRLFESDLIEADPVGQTRTYDSARKAA